MHLFNLKRLQKTVPCYQTKLAPPKKETKQSRALSENIKNFLAKKEQEEIQKKLEEKKRKEVSSGSLVSSYKITTNVPCTFNSCKQTIDIPKQTLTSLLTFLKAIFIFRTYKI